MSLPNWKFSVNQRPNKRALNQMPCDAFDTGPIGGQPVSSKERRDEYLAKAKEAEEHAEKIHDEANKAAWLRIAAGYHDLASRQGDAQN